MKRSFANSTKILLIWIVHLYIDLWNLYLAYFLLFVERSKTSG